MRDLARRFGFYAMSQGVAEVRLLDQGFSNQSVNTDHLRIMFTAGSDLKGLGRGQESAILTRSWVVPRLRLHQP